MIRCFYACVITALCFCGITLHAQQIVVLNNHDYDRAISPHAFVLQGRASLSDSSFFAPSDSARFLPNNSLQEVNYGLDRPRGWCRFSVSNQSDVQDWVLKIQQSRVDTLLMYVAREGGIIQRFPMTGHFQPLSMRAVQALPFAYSITIKQGETLTFYVYTARQYGKHAPIIRIQTRGHFESYEFGFNVLLGLVCGMVVLIALVGFFLFLFVKQRLYIYYTIYALSFLFVLITDSGLAHAVMFFPINQTVADGLTIMAYYWMGGCLGIFTIELLNLKHTNRKWAYWFGTILSCSLCVFALLLAIPWTPQIIRWALMSHSYYLAFVINAYILYVLSVNVRKKEPIVYFYMAGFYLTSLIAILILFADFEIINLQFENKDVMFLTPLAEILCVALGIGIHFSKTLKERVNVQLALNETQDQIITIQEDERKRIAQDLHDDVGNSLAAIKNMVIHRRESATVEKEIDNIIQSVRTISHDLMPVDFNEFPLVDILAHTVNKFKDHPTLALEFDYTGNVVKLKPTTELVIFRIINELITNIFKHSKATKAFIQLIYQQQSLVITVEDNGMGISKAKLEHGIGLRSIQSRAEYIQATLNIESDNKGTLIILEVPYENIR